mmetsp:Transcript_12629/g.41370  ORF Transcript_12629/g.41370 Transcript_12629/m.41370 type:complete len:164 (-) Transcript_12629:62-553(-)
MRLWLAALLPPPPHQRLPNSAVAVRTSPLIGMPSWSPLRLHVAISCGHTVFDFIPDKATAPSTLVQLLTGSSVRATIRQRPRGASGRAEWIFLGSTSRTEDELRAWVDSYPGDQLSLVSNNCWTFAAALASFALASRADEDVLSGGVYAGDHTAEEEDRSCSF